MTESSNNLSIYLIVGLNAACQIMLIWKLKMPKKAKVKFSALSVAIPLLVMMTMRLLVAVGAMHVRVAEQGGFERGITMLASILLIAGPPMATAASILSRRRAAAVAPDGELMPAHAE